ncbi:50S ribosomal protein L19 [Candidatus Gracilibacteria bacterium]|nr:50S ribosomal protein L19 [Candidatus Gracilibacteria bacterium]
MSNSKLISQIQGEFMKKDLPEIRTGMEVEIHQIIKENGKSRIQKFKGLVIKTAGKSEMEKTITVRRKIGAFGVEKIFSIHSTTIDKIDVIRKFKVRRKSIKFIRDLTGKAARLKEIRTPHAELNTPREIIVPEIMKKAPAKVATPKVEEITVETPAANDEAPKAEDKAA